jgi:hypothetical protein
MAFGDFNDDGVRDVVVYWAYSGKESLYVGLGERRFREIIRDQNFLEEEKKQPLLVEDVDGDGRRDILLVTPEFVRVLKVDDKNKLFVSRQINWEFDPVTHFTFFDKAGGTPRFVTLAGRQARVVKLNKDGDRFVADGRVDLQGLSMSGVKVADVDGSGGADLVLLGPKSVDILLAKPERNALESEVVLNTKLDYFLFWNVYPVDLDGDGGHEVLLFDSRKAMFEVCRPGPKGRLQTVLRHRLFEKTIFQRRKTDALTIPSEFDAADVNGDDRPDFVCVLQDRIGIYLQGPAKAAGGKKESPKKPSAREERRRGR